MTFSQNRPAKPADDKLMQCLAKGAVAAAEAACIAGVVPSLLPQRCRRACGSHA